MDIFCQDLADCDLFSNELNDDLPSLIDKYYHSVKSVIDCHAREKEQVRTLRPIAPWFSVDLSTAKKMRRHLEQKWRTTRSDTDRKQYVTQCKVVNEMIVHAKENYYAVLIDEHKGNQRALFRTVDKLLYRKPEAHFPSCSSDKLLVEQFNEFFTQKILAIRNSLMADANQLNIALYEPVFSNCELTCFEPVSTNHVCDLISSSKIKCCALDPLPASLMTKCLPILLPVITKIVNLSLSTALVPDLLKLAIISPTLKKTHLNHEFKNFRPVCNLPILSKIIERVVVFQLNDYLTVNGLKSAYKKNHSTESALLRVTNDILRAIDDNSSAILLLLDLSSAFDTVDHSIVLNRLEHCFGIRHCFELVSILSH